ncbi:DDX5, partial [Symbiodinium pilosum]
ITEERLKEELRKVISATAAEPSVHLDKIGDYYGDHVFMILRDIARQGHCDGDLSGAVQSGQFANLMSLGQTVHIRDLVAYFDTQRRRSWMEWWFLPRPHRLQIKKMRADDKATGEEAQPSAATSGVKLV